MVQISIKRSEADFINANPGWTMVYGRRKVGKTYMLLHYIDHDAYFSVNSDRTVHSPALPGGRIDRLETFTEVVLGMLREGKTCVVDEFQRLPVRPLEDIARAHPSGRLILSGSSMRTTEEFMGRNSPLLGLVIPSRLDLVRPSDLLASLSGPMTGEHALGLAPILRDPWTTTILDGEPFMERFVAGLRLMVPALVGEIFMDEERSLTQVYAAILSLIGGGHQDTWEIAQILGSRGIVRTGASANVLPYMNNMVGMGLLERTRAYGTKKFIYSMPSFPMGLYYYLDSRYGFSDRDVTYSEVAPTVEARLRLGIEGFLADLFAEALGGRKELYKAYDNELDLLVTVRNRPKLVGEVKWGRATKGDVSHFLSKVEDLRCRKVFVSRERIDTDEVEVLTPDDIVRMVAPPGRRARGRAGRRAKTGKGDEDRGPVRRGTSVNRGS